ncbi:hypothetical protein EGH22_19680 [Halomicroarcula sp. F28]|uniref:hypothetical protein n=1 Tax=Haloarcula salinisoli TaxID=2487746 RepID=UPI001C7383E6|nr:hypothetical protein [Halomicroarcula salinisoli]MBX0288555.1 hypothetical protein [Halomicroarcula salinisoli]
MSVDRSLPLATAFGLLVGCLLYQFLLSDWYPALAMAAVYAGTAYFYFAFDISLLGTQIKFNTRSDKIGYAIGLFGLCVSPLAMAEYTDVQQPVAIGLIVWVIGMFSFLLLATRAAHRHDLP